MVIFPHHLFQHLGAAQTLHPQGLTAGTFGAHHQCPAAVIAEGHTKYRCGGQQGGEKSLHGVGIDSGEQALRHGFVTVGVEQEAVFFVHMTNIRAHFFLCKTGGQQGKGCVDAPAENGMDHQLAVAGLVTEMFRQHDLVRGQSAGGGNLPFQIIAGRSGSRHVKAQSPQGFRQFSGLAGMFQSAQHSAEQFSGLPAPAFQFTFPERQAGALDRGLLYRHGIPADMHHLPCKSAQNKAVAPLGLIHEFFVRLAHFHALFGAHRIHAFVRNGTAGGDGQHPAVAVALHTAVQTVIENPRSGRDIPAVLMIAGQHPQYGFHIVFCHVAEGPCPGQQAHHVVHFIAFESRHGYQMLCQDIQTALRRIGLLHHAISGKLGRHAAEYTLGRCAGKKVHHAGTARIVAGPA